MYPDATDIHWRISEVFLGLTASASVQYGGCEYGCTSVRIWMLQRMYPRFSIAIFLVGSGGLTEAHQAGVSNTMISFSSLFDLRCFPVLWRIAWLLSMHGIVVGAWYFQPEKAGSHDGYNG
jgi:hypothetical protein